MPQSPISDTSIIEKVQRSAARFDTNDFSHRSCVTSMLIDLKWPLLEQRRNFLKLIMVHKILYGFLMSQSLSHPCQRLLGDIAYVL